MKLEPVEQESLDRMAKAGIVVSFAYGECGDKGIMWTVTAMNTRTLAEFNRPFAAVGFAHALEIAVLECEKRQWIERT